MIPYQHLVEELTKDQKKEVSGWMKGISQPVRRKLSNHAMGEDDTIFLPLEHNGEQEHVPVHPEVAAHLSTHGYRIASGQDYKAGYAVDPHNRQTKIGKALVRTGATADLVNKFNNDPNRALKSNEHLTVAVTRDPHHVAAMSTGRGWSSCMDLDEGMNKHYVPEELRAGTHVAYLIHKDDKKIDRPIARVALKPYVKLKHTDSPYGTTDPDRDDPHTVLRPEGQIYGTDNGALHHTISNWCDTHFPMKEDAIYRKHSKVYDDDGRVSIAKPSDATLKETIKKNEGVTDLLNHAASSKFNEHAYHTAIGMNAGEGPMRSIIGHKRTPKSVVNHYVANGMDGLDAEHQKKFAQHFIDRLYWQANKVEAGNVGKLLDHANMNEVDINHSFLQHPGLEDRHIDRMSKSNNLGNIAAIPRWKLAPHHVSALIDPPHDDRKAKYGAMSTVENGRIHQMAGTLSKEHSNLVIDKLLHTDADDYEGQSLYGRWQKAITPEHVPVEKLRAVANHLKDSTAKNHAWSNLISHPDVTLEDAKKYHETYPKGGARPLEDRNTFEKVVNNVQSPHAMNELLNGGSRHQMFQSMSVHKLFGDALAKHHAAGHEFAANLIAHPAMDLNASPGGIKPQHFELAKAMMNHNFVPRENDTDVDANIHSSNRAELAKTVAASNTLTKEQHADFLNTTVHHAMKEEGTSPLKTSLSDILETSARTTGYLHPDHAALLTPWRLDNLKQRKILK